MKKPCGVLCIICAIRCLHRLTGDFDVDDIAGRHEQPRTETASPANAPIESIPGSCQSQWTVPRSTWGPWKPPDSQFHTLHSVFLNKLFLSPLPPTSVAMSCGLSEFLAGFLPNWASSSQLTPHFLTQTSLGEPMQMS